MDFVIRGCGCFCKKLYTLGGATLIRNLHRVDRFARITLHPRSSPPRVFSLPARTPFYLRRGNSLFHRNRIARRGELVFRCRERMIDRSNGVEVIPRGEPFSYRSNGNRQAAPRNGEERPATAACERDGEGGKNEIPTVRQVVRLVSVDLARNGYRCRGYSYSYFIATLLEVGLDVVDQLHGGVSSSGCRPRLMLRGWLSSFHG